MGVRRVAVSSTDWLGLLAWLVNKPIIVGALTIDGLASTARTALRVAAEDVQLAFRHAAIVAELSVCSPVAFLFAVSNPLKDLAADSECCGNSIFCHSARIDLTRKK